MQLLEGRYTPGQTVVVDAERGAITIRAEDRVPAEA
jgi:hypothetical protein